jgi:hypothetical protein
MNKRNACGFDAGSMRVLGGASIAAGLLLVLSTFAAAQTIPQNTTGRNPGTQVPPGAAVPEATTAASQTTPDKRIQGGWRRQRRLIQVRRVQRAGEFRPICHWQLRSRRRCGLR